MTDPKPGAPSADRSRAACLIDRIFEYSSTDVDMHAMASVDLTTDRFYAATLRSGIPKLEFSPSTGGSASVRRDLRTVLGCLHLLNQMTLRIALTSQYRPDRLLSDKFYSNEYYARNTYRATKIDELGKEWTRTRYQQMFYRAQMVLARLREIMVEMYDDYSGTSSWYSGLADLFNP